MYGCMPPLLPREPPFLISTWLALGLNKDIAFLHQTNIYFDLLDVYIYNANLRIK